MSAKISSEGECMISSEYASIKAAIQFYESAEHGKKRLLAFRDSLRSHEAYGMVLHFVGSSGTAEIPPELTSLLLGFFYKEIDRCVIGISQAQGRITSPAGTVDQICGKTELQ